MIRCEIRTQPTDGVSLPRPLLLAQKKVGVNKNPRGSPFRVPSPTICPHRLISVAVLSTQPVCGRISLFRLSIPVAFDQIKGRPITTSGPTSKVKSWPPIMHKLATAFPDEPMTRPKVLIFDAELSVSPGRVPKSLMLPLGVQVTAWT